MDLKGLKGIYDELALEVEKNHLTELDFEEFEVRFGKKKKTILNALPIGKVKKIFFLIKNNSFWKLFLSLNSEEKNEVSEEIVEELEENFLSSIIVNNFELVCQIFNIALDQQKTQEEYEDEYTIGQILVLLICIFKVNISFFTKCLVMEKVKKLFTFEKMTEKLSNLTKTKQGSK